MALYAVIFQMQANQSGTYKQEFESLKNSDQYAVIFNKDYSLNVRTLRTSIENAKGEIKPTTLSKMISQDGLIITPSNMPKLYSYIATLCNTHNIAIPVILITTSNEMYNAFASKIFWSKGIVVIGKELLLDVSDETLEAVLAHELGHIKHNHVNKSLAILTTTLIASAVAAHYIVERYFKENKQLALVDIPFLHIPLMTIKVNTEQEILLAQIMAFIATSFIINKKFEKEADQFACQDANKAKGLITFFEGLQQKTNDETNAWITTKNILSSSKETIQKAEYNKLWYKYYINKAAKGLSDAIIWTYYNTPFGPHPSPEARIKAAQQYLETAEQAAA